MADKMFQNLGKVIDQVARERGVPRQILVEAIEKAFVKIAQKEFGKNKEIEASFNDDLGEVELFEFKTVVEVVEEGDELGISIEEAREKYDPGAEIGDSLGVKLSADVFGRISAQMAKQVILQHIELAERETIVSEYSSKVGDVVSGVVRLYKKGSLIVDLGKADAIMPRREQIPKERFQPGDRIRAYLLEINQGGREPQIILSRTDPRLIKKLFETEVPEIYEGVVEIIDVARDPGFRAKISVHSSDRNVDPIGACVGMKGVRVQAVVQELKGERIDIIEWSPDAVTYVCKALAPAEVVQVMVDDENHAMDLIVPDEQLSVAIGRRGQNVMLTSELTGWRIKVKSESDAATESKKTHDLLRSIPGVDIVTAELLYNAGYTSLEDILAATEEDLGGVHGIGAKLAREIQAGATVRLEEIKNQPEPDEEESPSPSVNEEAPPAADTADAG